MPSNDRVAVYVDFDNVVISRYDSLFGKGAWRSDEARSRAGVASSSDPVEQRVTAANVDIGAIIDYATSFGTVAFTRAYADWSVPANAAYRTQLVNRAVDLVQLFSTSGTKNGADIRLSIDAVDDLMRHPDLTHVVIVAGDSDYISLAQRCKRLGRYVVGVGVAGSTSRALVAACDEFTAYEQLPGVAAPPRREPKQPDRPAAQPGEVETPSAAPTKRAAAKRAATKKTAGTAAGDQPAADQPAGRESAARKSAATKDGRAAAPAVVDPTVVDPARELLLRAVRIGMEKSDDDWLHASTLKNQMQRLDPGFKEKALGFSTFAKFVKAHDDVVEQRVLDGGQWQVRLR